MLAHRQQVGCNLKVLREKFQGGWKTQAFIIKQFNIIQMVQDIIMKSGTRLHSFRLCILK